MGHHDISMLSMNSCNISRIDTSSPQSRRYGECKKRDPKACGFRIKRIAQIFDNLF